MSFKAIDCKMKEIYYGNINVIYNEEAEIESEQQEQEALILRSLNVLAMQNLTSIKMIVE